MFKKILTRLPLFVFILIVLAIVFRWDIKTISYQEEVKLSDGSFIWVDIKRHYVPTTSALGDGAPFTLSYKPTIVEISWDTGFEGVGRQSVFFNGGVVLIDKIDNVWYVVGGKPSFNGAYADSKALNCRDVGVLINNGYTCTYIFDKSGEKSISIANIEQFVKSININILTLDGLSDWEHNSGELENSQLSWVTKLKLNSLIQDKSRRSLDKPYSEY